MASPLVETKLHIPKLRRRLVTRPRPRTRKSPHVVMTAHHIGSYLAVIPKARHAGKEQS